MPYGLGLLLPFLLWPNQVLHVVSLIFFLKINFYKAVYPSHEYICDHLLFYDKKKLHSRAEKGLLNRKTVERITSVVFTNREEK